MESNAKCSAKSDTRKSVLLAKVGQISNEFNEKVLKEVTEDEMRVLEDVLDDLDPANLPLNDLFSGKMRAVIPFPTIDPSTELGKFAEFFRSQEYDVDWEKGMVYAERDYVQADDFLHTLGDSPTKKKTKKIQMKIGKLFSKLADLSRRKDAYTKKSMITWMVLVIRQMANQLQSPMLQRNAKAHLMRKNREF